MHDRLIRRDNHIDRLYRGHVKFYPSQSFAEDFDIHLLRPIAFCAAISLVAVMMRPSVLTSAIFASAIL